MDIKKQSLTFSTRQFTIISQSVAECAEKGVG
jgi:hypothetical protein